MVKGTEIVAFVWDHNISPIQIMGEDCKVKIIPKQTIFEMLKYFKFQESKKKKYKHLINPKPINHKEHKTNHELQNIIKEAIETYKIVRDDLPKKYKTTFGMEKFIKERMSGENPALTYGEDI